MSLPGLFIVGTDTGVGKTYVAASIARCLVRSGRRVGVLKPVATGALRKGDLLHSTDAEILIEAIGVDVEPSRVAPIVFEQPLAPPVAARLNGTPLSHPWVVQEVYRAIEWWAERAEILVVEGIGGLLCPLGESSTLADLAIALDFPLVIVARRGLGTLNHTLLTVEAAQRRGLRLAGVVLNAADPASDFQAESTNADELARRLERLAILADLPHAADPSALSTSLERVDWYGWAGAARGTASPETLTGAGRSEGCKASAEEIEQPCPEK